MYQMSCSCRFWYRSSMLEIGVCISSMHETLGRAVIEEMCLRPLDQSHVHQQAANYLHFWCAFVSQSGRNSFDRTYKEFVPHRTNECVLV